MKTYQDKLSVLSELIEFAIIDFRIKDSEYDFLLSVANLLEVKKSSLDNLLKKRISIKPPVTELEKVVRFHRLLLLMNVDQEQHKKEIEQLHNIGLWMGLRPSAIGQVLEVMHQYPNKMVPTEVLIGIFQAQQN